jgi:hypothetical protein
MSSVVAVCRKGLAFSTEVSIMTNRTLVSVPSDPVDVDLVLAERAIAVDATMNLRFRKARLDRVRKSFVNGNEAVTRVNVGCTLEAGSAKIPIRTIEALVTDPEDTLSTYQL